MRIHPHNFKTISRNNNEELKSLPEYMSMAKKIIIHFANKNFANSILRDEDSFSYVVERIILGDMRWNTDRGMTRYNYRNQCGRYAILTLYTLKENFKKREVLSINQDIKDTQVYEFIGNQENTPIENIINKEFVNEFEKIIDESGLTDIEKDCIQYRFYDSMTYNDIEKKLEIDKWKTREIVKRGLRKIRKYMKGFFYER